MRKCFIVNFYIYYNIYIHWHIHTYIYIYIYINIKNSGKPETVHRYWPVSEIYRTGGQIGTASGTVLTSLLWGAFLYINLGFSRRRSFLHLNDHSSCCHWSLKKNKRVCLYLVENPRKKESVDSEFARGRVSKFYW